MRELFKMSKRTSPSLKHLLQRLKRIINKYPNIEVCGNIYFIKNQYHIGAITKGTKRRCMIPETNSSRVIGDFHSHPSGDIDPSTVDITYMEHNIFSIIGHSGIFKIGILPKILLERFRDSPHSKLLYNNILSLFQEVTI